MAIQSPSDTPRDQVADDVDRFIAATHFVNAHDVRMAQLSGRAGLTQKLVNFCFGQLATPRQFQRDSPI